MGRESKIIQLNSSKVKSITKFTNELHDKVAELYECLMDDDILNAKKVKVEMTKQLTDLKIDFN